MKLNIDCLIDVLFAVEKCTGPNQYWNVGIDSGDGLAFYTPQEVYYHVQQCQKAGLIEVEAEFIDGSIEIADLTISGHCALESVRNPTVRHNAKNVWLSKVLDGAANATISGFFSAAAEIAKTVLLS